MKTITIEDDLYTFIASQTKHIGESASDILRRLLMPEDGAVIPEIDQSTVTQDVQEFEPESTPAPIEVAEPEAIAVEETREPNVQTDDVFGLIQSMELESQGSRVEQFLSILSALHQANQSAFSRVLDVKGRNRLYFGTSKEQLLEAGSSTNPKQVPDSGFWVVTNNNTAKKVSMLTQVADVLDYSADDCKKLATIFAPELA